MHLIPLLSLTVLLAAVCVIAFLLLSRHDNQLEAPVSTEEQPWLRQRVRDWLGLDHLHQQLHRQENTMAKVIDLLNGLVAQQTAASAAQASSFHNLQTAIARLEQAVRDGDASPEIQAAVNDLSAGFTALQQAADDADTGYEPTETPAPQEPTVPGEEPTGDVPATDPTVDPGTDTPDTDQPADTARR